MKLNVLGILSKSIKTYSPAPENPFTDEIPAKKKRKFGRRLKALALVKWSRATNRFIKRKLFLVCAFKNGFAFTMPKHLKRRDKKKWIVTINWFSNFMALSETVLQFIFNTRSFLVCSFFLCRCWLLMRPFIKTFDWKIEKHQIKSWTTCFAFSRQQCHRRQHRSESTSLSACVCVCLFD